MIPKEFVPKQAIEDSQRIFLTVIPREFVPKQAIDDSKAS